MADEKELIIKLNIETAGEESQGSLPPSEAKNSFGQFSTLVGGVGAASLLNRIPKIDSLTGRVPGAVSTIGSRISNMIAGAQDAARNLYRFGVNSFKNRRPKKEKALWTLKMDPLEEYDPLLMFEQTEHFKEEARQDNRATLRYNKQMMRASVGAGHRYHVGELVPSGAGDLGYIKFIHGFDERSDAVDLFQSLSGIDATKYIQLEKKREVRNIINDIKRRSRAQRTNIVYTSLDKWGELQPQTPEYKAGIGRIIEEHQWRNPPTQEELNARQLRADITFVGAEVDLIQQAIQAGIKKGSVLKGSKRRKRIGGGFSFSADIRDPLMGARAPLFYEGWNPSQLNFMGSHGAPKLPEQYSRERFGERLTKEQVDDWEVSLYNPQYLAKSRRRRLARNFARGVGKAIGGIGKVAVGLPVAFKGVAGIAAGIADEVQGYANLAPIIDESTGTTAMGDLAAIVSSATSAIISVLPAVQKSGELFTSRSLVGDTKVAGAGSAFSQRLADYSQEYLIEQQKHYFNNWVQRKVIERMTRHTLKGDY